MSEKLKINGIRILFLVAFVFLVRRGTPMLWLALFGLSLLGATFFGRFYCGWVCPMNTMMVGTESLTRRLGIKLKKAPAWLASGWLRWLVLLASIFLMGFGKVVLQRDIPILMVLLILSVVMTLRYKPEVFHNNVCPFGILQGAAGQFAAYSRGVEPSACVGCKKCETVCPAQAITVSKNTRKAVIDPQLCHQCTSCTLICPTQATSYGRRTSFGLKTEEEAV